MNHKLSVAVVFHYIGPYHHARLNAAADRLSVTGIEWSAKGCEAWGEADSPARYNKVSLFAEATAQYPAKAELQRAFWKALEQTNPDVVAVYAGANLVPHIAAGIRLAPRAAVGSNVRSEPRDEIRPSAQGK